MDSTKENPLIPMNALIAYAQSETRHRSCFIRDLQSLSFDEETECTFFYRQTTFEFVGDAIYMGEGLHLKLSQALLDEKDLDLRKFVTLLLEQTEECFGGHFVQLWLSKDARMDDGISASTENIDNGFTQKETEPPAFYSSSNPSHHNHKVGNYRSPQEPSPSLFQSPALKNAIQALRQLGFDLVHPFLLQPLNKKYVAMICKI